MIRLVWRGRFRTVVNNVFDGFWCKQYGEDGSLLEDQDGIERLDDEKQNKDLAAQTKATIAKLC